MVLAPSRLDEFELSDPLGTGATSRVFDAKHRVTGTPVAIKMLESTARDTDQLRQRFAREAVVLAGVQSAHVGRILGFGVEQERPFLVLEKLEGKTLGQVLRKEGSLSTEQIIEWFEQLLVGVRDCHDARVVHRDIKPANIFLSRSSAGETIVKLIDFGVARLDEISIATKSLTSTHHLLGSVGYMAPEQLQSSKGVGPEVDLYSAGVVLFRCVTGRLPFIASTFEALMRVKIERDAPRLSSISSAVRHELLDAYLSRSLARNPKDRFPDARAMLEDWWRVSSALRRDPLGAADFDRAGRDDDTEVGGATHDEDATSRNVIDRSTFVVDDDDATEIGTALRATHRP